MLLKSFFHKSQLKIDHKPFASGGEGNLFHIIEPKKSRGRYIAKLYHPHKLGPERQKKLHFLYEHPPIELTENKHPSVVWVVDLLYNAGDQLVGFVMPFVKGEKLEILCTQKLPKQIDKVWNRFELLNPAARNLRLRLCFNIAVAIYEVHSTRNYVLVDLKPDNVIVQPNGLIALVDTDSVEVVSGSSTLFDAPVATPEYSPAEYYIRDKLGYDPTAVQEWDLFSLAVIFYKLLFGIHPFAAGNSAPYEHCIGLEQKIEAGLFVHAPDKQKFMAVIPPPHQAFKQIPQELQDLFMQCFVDGHNSPEKRPTAEEWCQGLLKSIDDPKLHEHFDHLFAAQYFDKKVAMPRKLASEIYSDLGIEDILKQKVKPHFIDFNVPTLPKKPTLANDKLAVFDSDVQPRGIYFFLFCFVISLLIAIVASQESEPNFLVGMSLFIGITGVILWPTFNYLSYSSASLNLEKEQVESRLTTAFKLFKARAGQFNKWAHLLKNIDFDSLEERWNSLLGKSKESFEQQLNRIDSKIDLLYQAENEAYHKIYLNFIAAVRKHPLLKDLEGDDTNALRDAINLQKEQTDHWRAQREAFNDLIFEYRQYYIKAKSDFDLQYQQLMDEAKAVREAHKDEIIEKQIELNSTVEAVNLRKIPIDLLEPIPKYLENMKEDIEKLQLRKEELKNINYHNYLWMKRK